MRTRVALTVVILAGVLALSAGGVNLTPAPLRGDSNGDGVVDVADVFHLINALFAGGAAAVTPCAGDADASGSMEVGDVFFLINHLFAGGPAPGNPVATVTAPPGACMEAAGLVASVPAQAGAAYAWTVNGGTITAGEGTNEITWSAGTPGTATVSCTVTVADCSAAGSAPVTVDGPVIESLAAEPAAVELGESSTLSFTITGATGWTLASSIGNSFSAQAGAGSGAFSTTYNADNNSGTDTVTLTASSACGAVQSTTTVQVCQDPDATVTAPASVCFDSTGNTASVPDAGVGAGYVWGIINGTITGGGGTREITWDAGASGPVGLTCSVTTAAGCSSSGGASVTVSTRPGIRALTATPGTIELGGTSTISLRIVEAASWTLGSSLGNGLDPSSGVGSGTFEVTYTASAASGLDTITLTVTNGCGSTQRPQLILVEGGDEITIYLGPGNTVPLVLVRTPAGTFQMGAPTDERGSHDREKPQHEVTLSQAYYLGKTEVTQRQWVAVMGENPSGACENYGIGDDYPVYCVSWGDICGWATGSSCTPGSFIGKVNASLRSTKFRLPTEAEWERAARGATTTEFSFAVPSNWDTGCESFPEAELHMWWCRNNTPEGGKPVGTKEANPYGLHDMHGNLREWVGDWYGDYTAGAVTDPPGPTTGSGRVLRSCCWGDFARDCRSAYRGYSNPGGRNGYVGFRLAWSP